MEALPGRGSLRRVRRRPKQLAPRRARILRRRRPQARRVARKPVPAIRRWGAPRSSPPPRQSQRSSRLRSRLPTHRRAPRPASRRHHRMHPPRPVRRRRRQRTPRQRSRPRHRPPVRSLRMDPAMASQPLPAGLRRRPLGQAARPTAQPPDRETRRTSVAHATAAPTGVLPARARQHIPAGGRPRHRRSPSTWRTRRRAGLRPCLPSIASLPTRCASRRIARSIQSWPRP